MFEVRLTLCVLVRILVAITCMVGDSTPVSIAACVPVGIAMHTEHGECRTKIEIEFCNLHILTVDVEIGCRSRTIVVIAALHEQS